MYEIALDISFYVESYNALYKIVAPPIYNYHPLRTKN